MHSISLALFLGLALCPPPLQAQAPQGDASGDSVRPLPVRPKGKVSMNVGSFYPMWKTNSEFGHSGVIGQDSQASYQLPPKSTLKLDLVSDTPANLMIIPIGRGHRPAPVSGLSRRSYTLENRESTPEVLNVKITSRSIGPGVGAYFAYTINITRSWDPAPLHPRLGAAPAAKAWEEAPEVQIDALEATYDPGDCLYPYEAVSKRVQGEVLVEALISKEGVPTGVRVLSGPEPLREAAEAYAWEWCFAPPRHKWKNQPVRLKMTLPFKLDIL